MADQEKPLLTDSDDEEQPRGYEEDGSIIHQQVLNMVPLQEEVKTRKTNLSKKIIVALVFLVVLLVIGLLIAVFKSQTCPSVTTPPPVARKRSPNSDSGEKSMFFLLSDLHYDLFYNDNITKDTLCRSVRTISPNHTAKKSPYTAMFGRRGCDTPSSLLQATALKMSELNQNSSVDFVLITGDQTAHAYNYFLLNSIEDTVLKSIADSTKMVAGGVGGKTPVFTVVGNNDLVKDYEPPLRSNSKFYKRYADIIKPYIFVGADVTRHNDKRTFEKTFNDAGYYSLNLKGKRLKLISLNTNYMLTRAFKLKGGVVYLADKQMTWLHAELAQAQTDRQKVIIAGHVPPGCSSYRMACNAWMTNYTKIYLDYTTNKFQSIIKAQFYGHTHQDRIRFQYSTNTYRPHVATKSYVFLSPGITPIYENNPAFRRVSFDMNRMQLHDYEQYYLDLTLSNVMGVASWQHEYTFKAEYSSPSLEPPAIEKLIDNLAGAHDTWVRYSMHMYASFGAHNATTRFIEYCAAKYAYQAPFERCLGEYKNALA